MELSPTTRLYLQDDHSFETEAVVLEVRPDALACDRTCFYPGGGGQPPDTGTVLLPGGGTLAVTSVEADGSGILWHISCDPIPPGLAGQSVRLVLDSERRRSLMRYHTVLHVLNTIVLRDYDGWITGVQIGTDGSRIDFKLEGLTPALCAELEAKVNAILAGDHLLRAYYLPEEEFRRRPDLLRTLDARPPVRDGQVRVVEIAGFDAQACGGTHVRSTAEVGRFSIVRTENKGKNNKRLYVRLEPL